jgi:hypothetical protein
MKAFFLILLYAAAQCHPAPNMASASAKPAPASQTIVLKENKNQRVVHVFVALCDNKNQGIQPVPAAIGNGQDPDKNLYWGCDYGIRSFFKKDAEWTMVSKQKNIRAQVLERCIFRHKASNTLLIADAYDGAAIKQCTLDYFSSCAGQFSDSAVTGGNTVYTGGAANLIAYIGHDGLMDFSISEKFVQQNNHPRQAIALACISKNYFAPHLKTTGASPLLWTTGLMCPEAYTLDAAVKGWINKESNEQIRQRAAAAYHRYQRCGLKAARNLLVSGWEN